MVNQTGPCGWSVEICDSCCGTVLDGMNPVQVETIKQMAVNFLWNGTGKQYGLCAKTYRPCRRTCFNSGVLGGYPSLPYKFGGLWYNLTCSSCAGSCSCRNISEVYLPDTYAVTGLRIDGETLDPLTEVLVYDYSRIVRANGVAWPDCQDLSVDADQAGTWEITILKGNPVPAGGELIAGILACEMAKACTGSEDCRLPKRIQTITRQGITVGFQDAFDGLKDMRTGLWEVDAWLEASRATRWQAPVIGSPDLPDFPQLTFPTSEFVPTPPGGGVFDGGSP